MTRTTSVYLDLLRVLAALTVFLAHASWQQDSGGLLWPMNGHGREAVDVFFVISGFVIAHVAATSELSPLTYAVNRAARVLSVMLPALALTFVLDSIGRDLKPLLYEGWCCDIAGSTAWQFFGSAFFIGDIWGHHTAPGSDIPYWSLGYEVWYYVAFGLLAFLRRPWGLLGAIGLMLAVGPGIAVLFPLWLLGGLVYRLGARHPPGPRLAMALYASSLLAFIANLLLGIRYGEIYDSFSFAPERLHDYLQDAIVAGLTAAHLYAVSGLSGVLSAPMARIARPVRWLGGATFALYLFHLPLIHIVVAVAPWPETSWITRTLVFLGVPLLVLLLAEITERRKSAWRRALLWAIRAPRSPPGEAGRGGGLALHRDVTP